MAGRNPSSPGFSGTLVGYRNTRRVSNSPVDELAIAELEQLRAICRDLCRNLALGSSARTTFATSLVDTGIEVSFNNPLHRKQWAIWKEHCNVDGYGNLGNTQALWAQEIFQSGEIFTQMHLMDNPNKDVKVPLMLQNISADFLDLRFTEMQNNIRAGMKFDKFGKPLEYHLWNRHPRTRMNTDLLKRIAVSADDLLHIFNRTEAGQWRGIPVLAPAVLGLVESDELFDRTLVLKKAATAVGWIVYEDENYAPPAIGAIEGLDSQRKVSESSETARIQEVTPGGVHYLKGKERIAFANSSPNAADIPNLLASQTRWCASAIYMLYEQMTGDLTNVNYSSIRAGLVEVRKKIKVLQWLMIINRGLRPLVDRYKELGSYYYKSSLASAEYKFILPKLEHVDPVKDVQADALEVRNGFATLKDKLEERGIADVEEHIMQVMEEQGYPVVLDSNPKITLKGQNTARASKETKSNTNSTGDKNNEQTTTTAGSE